MNNFELFQELMKTREGLAGDIAEFGVYAGDTTRLLAGLGRRVWAFDTYNGMPALDYDYNSDQDRCNPPGKFNPCKTPGELFEGYKNITPVVGRFADTLQTIKPSVKFVLVFVDCDYYASHKQVLRWLPRRLVDGAVLVFDDYQRCKGAKNAIDEFLQKYKDLKLEYEDRVIQWLKV